MTEPPSAPRQILVWDLPTRVFHWALAIVVTLLILTGLDGKLDWHMKLGQVALALGLFRLIWGFIGNRQARFIDFIAGPRAIIAYLRGLFGKDGPRYLGHNPVGGYAVLAMLGLVLMQATTGLFTTDDIATDGPLYGKVSSAVSGRLTSLHHWGFNALVVVILAHLAANLFYLLVKNDNLVTPMVTGAKDVDPSVAEPEPKGAGPLVALILFAACLTLVFGGVAWLAK